MSHCFCSFVFKASGLKRSCVGILDKSFLSVTWLWVQFGSLCSLQVKEPSTLVSGIYPMYNILLLSVVFSLFFCSSTQEDYNILHGSVLVLHMRIRVGSYANCKFLPLLTIVGLLPRLLTHQLLSLLNSVHNSLADSARDCLRLVHSSCWEKYNKYWQIWVNMQFSSRPREKACRFRLLLMKSCSCTVLFL
jgi:hypothetical protein